MSRTNSEYKPPPRPPSEQLSDVHVYIVPTDIWRKRYNNLLNSSVTETISLGIIRIHPDVKVYLLRDELEQQIGTQLLPREYVFLKSVGRSLTRLKPKQEYQLKAKTFLPPNAYASEIYLLESYEGQFGPGSSDASTRTHTRNSFRATDEGYSSYKDGHPSSRMFPDDSTSRNYYNLHNGHSSGRKPAKSRQTSAAPRHVSSLSREYSLDPKFGEPHSDSSAPYISNSGEWNAATSKYESHNTDQLNDVNIQGQGHRPYDSRSRAVSGDIVTSEVNVSRPNNSDSNISVEHKTNVSNGQGYKGGNSEVHNDPHFESNTDKGHHSGERGYQYSQKDMGENVPNQASFNKQTRTGRTLSRNNSRVGSRTRRSNDRKNESNRTHHSQSPSSEHQQSVSKDKAPSCGEFGKPTSSDNYNNVITDSRIGGYSPDSQHRSRYRDDIDSPRRKGAVVEDGVRDQERGYKSDGSPSHKNHHKDDDKRGAYGQRSDDVRKSQDRLNDSQKGDEWNDDHKRDRRRRNDSQRKDDEWSDDDTRDRRRRHDSQRKDELSDDDTQNRQRRGGGGADDDDDDYYSEGDENSHRKHKRRSERSDGEDDYSDDNDENSKSGRRRRRRHSDRKKNGNDNASERLDQSDEELNRFPSPPGVPRGALEPFEDISNINDKDKLMAILEKQRSQRKAAEKEREDLVKKVKQMQSKTQNRRNFGDIEDLQARDIWKKRYFEEKKKTPPLEDQCNKLRQELDALHRRLMTTLEGPKERHIKLNDKHPSQKNNYKLQAIKLQHEIEDMRRRVENSKMKLTAEMKLRNQAETELRALRAELTQKKINLSLTRTSQLAALTAPDKLPAIQNTKQPITPRS